MKTLFIDNWEGKRDKGENFKVDSSFQIEDILKRLDGKKCTQILILEEEDDYKEHSLLIGGGNQGICVVTYTVGDEEEFYNLCNPLFMNDDKDEEENEIALTTGGQLGLFARKYCVPLETVIEATKYYIDKGGMNPALIWEED